MESMDTKLSKTGLKGWILNTVQTTINSRGYSSFKNVFPPSRTEPISTMISFDKETSRLYKDMFTVKIERTLFEISILKDVVVTFNKIIRISRF